MTIIMAITIKDRGESVKHVQTILSEYHSCIQTRLGLSNALPDNPEGGLIILHLYCEKNCCDGELKERLEKINGVLVSIMELKV